MASKDYRHYEALLLQHVKLLCDLDPKRVVAELKKEYYPVQESTEICSAKGHKAAVAYLMHCSGDLAKSFEKYTEVLADCYEKILQSKDKKTFDENVNDFEVNLSTAMEVCKENSKAMTNEQQGEELWFKLLDHIYGYSLKLSETQKKTDALKEATGVMSRCMKMLLKEMMDFVSFPRLLTRVANDHGELQIDSFGEMFKDMLFSYVYQEKILETARNIASGNIVQQFDSLVKLTGKGFPMLQAKCDKCEESVETRNAIEVTVYPCGHIYHAECVDPNAMCFSCTYKEISMFCVTGRGLVFGAVSRETG